MAKPTPMNRVLLLDGKVNEQTIKPLIQQMIDINNDDDQKEKEYKDWVREPIKLFISSEGGEVYQGLALYDMIRESKTPVYTIALGRAMSMGLWIFMAGEKRFIGKRSFLMFHDVSVTIGDKVEGIKNWLEHSKDIQKLLFESILCKNVSISKTELQSYIDKKQDWYISADEAVRLNFANDYYEYDILNS